MTETKEETALAPRDHILNLVEQLTNVPEHLPEDLKRTVVKTIQDRIQYHEDWQEAHEIAGSELVPDCYKGKPYNAVVAFRKGRSLGLDRQQSVNNLYTVNGHTRIWGDMMLAIATTDPRFIDCIEEFGPDIEVDETVHGKMPEWAKCTVKVKDQEDKVCLYTLDDAKKNPNFDSDKVKTWRTNGKRMMQFKARSFALRDALPARLGGLYDEYEFEEIDTKDITSNVVDLGKDADGVSSLKDALNQDKTGTNGHDVEIEEPGSEGDESTEKQEKPENIETIALDFAQWKKKKVIDADTYKKYRDAGTTGKWDQVVSMHTDIKKLQSEDIEPEEIEDQPSDSADMSFVNRLKGIVDDPDYESPIKSLLEAGKLEDPKVKNELRTDDEKTAERVFDLIMQYKGFESAEQPAAN
jgi:hypothetical protein